MRIYSNVTEQNLFNLRKLAEQQENQRALKPEKQNFKTNTRCGTSRKLITYY